MTQNIYHLALTYHVIGLVIMAGATFMDFIITKQFWKQYAAEKSKGLAIKEITSKFPRIFGIGMVLLIISGVGMMVITNGVFGEQIWFRIKFSIVIVIILNGLIVGRRQSNKLNKLLSEESTMGNNESKLLNVKNKIKWFHISQMIMFITIFVLSAFKFN